MTTQMFNDHEAVNKLIKIGMELSATQRLPDLLKLIVTEARNLTRCDAGSLFIKEGDNLRFMVAQNDTLDKRYTAEQSVVISPFKEITIPITTDSIAGYVALTKKTEIISDTYAINDQKPYRHNKKFDEDNNYRTLSMLAIPMKDRNNNVVGVLQLINHVDENGEASPFSAWAVPMAESLASQASVAIRNSQLMHELKDVQFDTIVRLSTAAEFRDTETGNHVKRVGKYSKIIAEQLGMDENRQELLWIASPMHDVGKIGIADGLLRKPGRFTPEERKVMETHTDLGRQIMEGSTSPMLQMCATIAYTHHEKWDGTGYPLGLSGEDIPLEGRIVALADVFDALVSKRVYKDAFPLDQVFEILRKDAGTHFDPTVIEAFFDALPEIMEVFETLRD